MGNSSIPLYLSVVSYHVKMQGCCGNRLKETVLSEIFCFFP